MTVKLEFVGGPRDGETFLTEFCRGAIQLFGSEILHGGAYVHDERRGRKALYWVTRPTFTYSLTYWEE